MFLIIRLGFLLERLSQIAVARVDLSRKKKLSILLCRARSILLDFV